MVTVTLKLSDTPQLQIKVTSSFEAKGMLFFGTFQIFTSKNEIYSSLKHKEEFDSLTLAICIGSWNRHNKMHPKSKNS